MSRIEQHVRINRGVDANHSRIDCRKITCHTLEKVDGCKTSEKQDVHL